MLKANQTRPRQKVVIVEVTGHNDINLPISAAIGRM